MDTQTGGSAGAAASPIYAELYLVLVVGHGPVDAGKTQANVLAKIPADGRADDACAKVIPARVVVPQNKCKVLQDIVQQHTERLGSGDMVLGSKNAVHKGLTIDELEVSRVAGAEELDNHLDQLLAGKLRPGQRLQHAPSMPSKEGLALPDPLPICAFQLEPVVGVELLEG